MITIYDIAKETGFSAPTVSKALNGTGGLSQETRRKILEAAEAMGYKPNFAARALSTKKSNLIGIIFEDKYMARGFEHPLFGGVLTQIRKQLEDNGYDCIFLSHDLGEHAVNSYIDHCHLRDVDAVVIINPFEDYEKLSEMAASGIPCVSANDIIPGIPTVISDNEAAGYQAGKYLLKMGHRNVAYISGYTNEHSRAGQERLEGLQKAFAEEGLQIPEQNIEIRSYWSRQEGYGAMESLLAKNPGITAVFAANDDIAIGAMNYCKDKGMSVPQDMSVIGFDDETFSEFYQPTLTTFRQNRSLIAEVCNIILMNQLIGAPYPTIKRIPVDFIERNSVTVPRS